MLGEVKGYLSNFKKCILIQQQLLTIVQIQILADQAEILANKCIFIGAQHDFDLLTAQIRRLSIFFIYKYAHALR